jgi:type 1 glutamine amidotransferase
MGATMSLRIFAVLMLVGLASSVVSADAAVPADSAAPRKLKVCLLSGCDTYNSEESLPPFQEYLEKNYPVECVRIVKKVKDDLPGLEQLEQCDVAFVFIKRMGLKDGQLEQFKKYMTSGRPIVAVRTASHAVQTWLDFDKLVLGGNYKSHHPAGPVTKIEVTDGSEGHPILAGVKLTSAADSLYKNLGHADDIRVLLTGTIEGQPTEPIAWTREVNGGRVFYTSLGSQETFREPAFRRMLANAIFWAAKREATSK